VTGWTVPDQDLLLRIIFQLQRPDCHVHPPCTGNSPDGTLHASNGTTDPAAGSLAALLDELDSFYAT